MHGQLCLEFASQDGQTRLIGRRQTPPLQVVRAFDLTDGASLVHLHNISGGVLGGDQLKIAVQIGPQARAQLTTTSATQVYRSRDSGLPAVQIMEVTIADGGLLEYLPDPLIPFAGSRYRQETRITLDRGAGLFWWETIAPGRIAHGELFAYDRLELNFDLTAAGRPIARERLRLDPLQRPLSSAARLGPYCYFTTFYICREGLPASCWQSLEAEMSTQATKLNRTDELLWGASTLPAHGLSIRGLSINGRDLMPGLIAFWQTAKRALYGRDVIVPRKVY